MIGASAHHTRAEPSEFRARSRGIRLALQLPAPANGGHEAIGLAGTEVCLTAVLSRAVAVIVRPFIGLVVPLGVQHRTRLDQGYLDPLLAKDPRHGASAGTGAHNDYVIFLVGHPRLPCL